MNENARNAIVAYARCSRAKSGHQIWFAAVLVGCAVWLASSRAGAVACPAGGAQLEICVENPTGGPVHNVRLYSTQAGAFTCTGPAPIQSNYDFLVDLNPGSNCFNPPSGLWSATYVHHIQYVAADRLQHQKGPVLYSSDPGHIARVDWTYFPNVLTVTGLGDSGCGDASCSGSSCATLRQAINRANSQAGPGSPVLVRFAVSGTITLTAWTPPLPECDLELKKFVTVDGTDIDGNPWIVGDYNAAMAGKQDPFPVVIDLVGHQNIQLTDVGNTLKGLHIKNTLASGEVQNMNLIRIHAAAPNSVIRAVKIDGGNTLDCSATPAPEGCNRTFDLISVAGTGTQIMNVEGHSAIDEGVKAIVGNPADAGGSATVSDSWFHHNYKGALQAGESQAPALQSQLIVNRTVSELAGRRVTDNKVMISDPNADSSGLTAVNGSAVTASKSIL